MGTSASKAPGGARSTEDAALGCLLGLACGDAAGAPLEFIGRRPTPEEAKACLRMPGGGPIRVGPGQVRRFRCQGARASLSSAQGERAAAVRPTANTSKQAVLRQRLLCRRSVLCIATQVTDDTELALALAHGLLDAASARLSQPPGGGEDDDAWRRLPFPSVAVARRYAEWLASWPFDVGITCRKAFAELEGLPEWAALRGPEDMRRAQVRREGGWRRRREGGGGRRRRREEEAAGTLKGRDARGLAAGLVLGPCGSVAGSSEERPPLLTGWASRRTLQDCMPACGGCVRAQDGLEQRLARVARQAASSQANGALMRAAPLAVWGHRLPVETLAACARADARLSHPSPVCQVRWRLVANRKSSMQRTLPSPPPRSRQP